MYSSAVVPRVHAIMLLARLFASTIANGNFNATVLLHYQYYKRSLTRTRIKAYYFICTWTEHG